MGKNWYLVTIEDEQELSEFLFACLEREQGLLVQPFSEDERSELENDLGELGEEIEREEPER